MPKTYNEIYLELRKAFRESGIDGYSLEARHIVAFAAGKTVDVLMRDLQLYASDGLADKIRGLAARRLDGEPLAYITGSCEFYGLPISVSRGVLIPRMDTELLARTAIEHLRETNPSARVLDLCAGSGCVGIAIVSALPAVKLSLVDSSQKALDTARYNLGQNGLSSQASCIAGDVRKSPPAMLGNFELVVCNPPYIPTDVIATLDRTVRDFEPKRALDGGKDGLNFYRAILKNWRGVFRDGACLMFEVGIGASDEVMKIMRINGFKGVNYKIDTGGIARVVYGHL